MQKKILALLLALVMAVAVFAGCQTPAEPSRSTVRPGLAYSSAPAMEEFCA